MRWRRRRRAQLAFLSNEQYEELVARRSPGSWVAPSGVLLGWNWLPPDHGVQPAWERVPWWVRAWYRTPFADRYAHVWMWHHGGFELLPHDPEPGTGVREPLRPRPPAPRRG